jgi:hypothetical protein
MSSDASSLDLSPSRSSSRSWVRAPALWAGLSIMTMWLAVLVIGVFGPNIVSSTPGGTSTSVPVVVALIPFVLPATVVVARRGFRELAHEQSPTPDQQRQSTARTTAEGSELRTKVA